MKNSNVVSNKQSDNKLSIRKNTLLSPDSTKKNFTFQLLYQVVILVIPLIVSPYLTRTLGGKSLGVYSYTYSIAYYFVVFAMLGINTHGQRIISQRRGNIVELRKTFWSLYCVHFITSLTALVAYIFYVILICKSDVDIAFVQTIYVASAIFDLTWLFFGLEKFKMVTIRNAVVKLINTVCIFLFVKEPADIAIYTLIMTVSTIVANLLLFLQALRAIPPIKFDKPYVIEHLKPLWTLFAAVMAATLYTVFDKTLLGLILSKESVAYYEYSDKIINIPKTFISIINTVLFPKACQYAAVKDYKGMRSNMEKSLTVICLIGFASVFGLLAIAKPFALVYYGDEFAICGQIISLLCPLILIIGIGDAVRSQYIYPLKMDIIMVKVLFLNAIINIVLSATLIPVLGIVGAVAGTMAAEINGLAIEIYLVRKYVSFKSIIVTCIPYAINGAIMFVIVKAVSIVAGTGWRSLAIQGLIGGIVYSIGAFIYIFFFKRELLDLGFNEIMRKIKKK